MRTRSKLLFAGLLAAFTLSMAVASASANHLSTSSQGFRVVWAALVFNGGGNTITCPITMEGSFHSATIAKVVGSLIGSVTRATIANGSCTGGHATVLQEHLPWHVQYGGFGGTLPNITEVTLDLVNAVFRVEAGGLTCTTTTTQEHPAVGIAHRNTRTGALTTLRANERTGIPLRGSFLCEFAGEGTFTGEGNVTTPGSSTAVTVTLI